MRRSDPCHIGFMEVRGRAVGRVRSLVVSVDSASRLSRLAAAATGEAVLYVLASVGSGKPEKVIMMSSAKSRRVAIKDRRQADRLARLVPEGGRRYVQEQLR